MSSTDGAFSDFDKPNGGRYAHPEAFSSAARGAMDSAPMRLSARF
jgi:hypothetical protein